MGTVLDFIDPLEETTRPIELPLPRDPGLDELEARLSRRVAEVIRAELAASGRHESIKSVRLTVELGS